MRLWDCMMMGRLLVMPVPASQLFFGRMCLHSLPMRLLLSWKKVFCPVLLPSLQGWSGAKELSGTMKHAPKLISIEYQFYLADGTREVFRLHFDEQNLELVLKELPEILPSWTELSFHQCPNCSLKPEESPYCPFWNAGAEEEISSQACQRRNDCRVCAHRARTRI